MVNGLVGAVAAADSPYSILAIFLIGLYVLGWRWGGKFLDRLNQETTTSQELSARLDLLEQRMSEVENDTTQ